MTRGCSPPTSPTTCTATLIRLLTTQQMASVTKKAQPGTIDPTGSGSFMVVDCLDRFRRRRAIRFCFCTQR